MGSHIKVTANRLWKCPKCGCLLEKPGLGRHWSPGDPVSRVRGTATCGRCGAQYEQAHVYGGKYDVEEPGHDEAPLESEGPVEQVLTPVAWDEGDRPDAETEAQHIIRDWKLLYLREAYIGATVRSGLLDSGWFLRQVVEQPEGVVDVLEGRTSRLVLRDVPIPIASTGEIKRCDVAFDAERLLLMLVPAREDARYCWQGRAWTPRGHQMLDLGRLMRLLARSRSPEHRPFADALRRPARERQEAVLRLEGLLAAEGTLTRATTALLLAAFGARSLPLSEMLGISDPILVGAAARAARLLRAHSEAQAVAQTLRRLKARMILIECGGAAEGPPRGKSDAVGRELGKLRSWLCRELLLALAELCPAEALMVASELATYPRVSQPPAALLQPYRGDAASAIQLAAVSPNLESSQEALGLLGAAEALLANAASETMVWPWSSHPHSAWLNEVWCGFTVRTVREALLAVRRRRRQMERELGLPGPRWWDRVMEFLTR